MARRVQTKARTPAREPSRAAINYEIGSSQAVLTGPRGQQFIRLIAEEVILGG